MNPHELLLKAIQDRQVKRSEFNEGILTADRYVRTLQECVGSDLCYRYASKGNISFSDLMKKAASTLTYNNPEMVVEDLYGKAYEWTDADGDELELPKNTLMVFKHVLTTPKKDRDGDIMRTQGAKVDPKMLLLSNHVHTLPIGKMLKVYEHTSKKLSLISAIIDMNDLCHDSAVMIDNKMGRFSHGFRAMEFAKVKEHGYEEEGFDVKAFEIMEESLVSVPSNTDAEVQEVILSLVESGKLKSQMMRSVGSSIRLKRSKSVSVETDVGKLSLDLNITVNGKAVTGEKKKEEEHVETKCTGVTGCGCGCQASTSTSEETDANDLEEIKGAADKEMTCQKCGSKVVDGVCEKCGYKLKSEVESEQKEDFEIEEKAGRTINSKNLQTLTHAKDCMQEVHDKEHLMTKGGRSLCRDAIKSIGDVMASAGSPNLEEASTTVNAVKAMGVFLGSATKAERARMKSALKAMEDNERSEKEIGEFRTLMGANGSN